MYAQSAQITQKQDGHNTYVIIKNNKQCTLLGLSPK